MFNFPIFATRYQIYQIFVTKRVQKQYERYLSSIIHVFTALAIIWTWTIKKEVYTLRDFEAELCFPLFLAEFEIC